MIYRRSKHIFIILVAAIFFGIIPAEFGHEANFFHGYMIPKPIISIGIGLNLKEAKITASSGMKVYEIKDFYKSVSEETNEVYIKSSAERLTEKYLIVLSMARNRKEAERVAEDVRAKFGGNIIIQEQEVSGAQNVFVVKLGDFLVRSQALEKIQSLKSAGYENSWISTEEIPEKSASPFWLLTNGKLYTLEPTSILYFIPATPQSYLMVNGRPYRGLFILRSSRTGMTLVNVLNLEDYLKSVVPAELSPEEFASLEALKAQAVAARTYALKNMGQYQSSGFDLVFTPRSQYYPGMISENDLSTRAVEQTRGEVIVYKGDLINALYTSTCGGRTENVENVFTGEPVPYLKSVDCSYERQPEWLLRSSASGIPVVIGNYDASFEVALLISLGIIQLPVGQFDFLAQCTFEEAREWVDNTRRFLEIKAAEKPIGSKEPLDFIRLSDLVVESFSWEERVAHLVRPSETDFVTRDNSQITLKEKNSFTYCLQQNFFPTLDLASSPSKSLSRAEVAVLLARIITGQKDIFQNGVFLAARGEQIEVRVGQETKTVGLSHYLYLLRNVELRPSLTTNLVLLGGEKIRWLEREGQVSFLEVFYPPVSDVLDRSSRFSRWQVVRTREELEKRLNQYYPVGALVDVSVKKRGPSGRAVELLITGKDNQFKVGGLQIRNVLGLRDNLFVVDRAYDQSGLVNQFIFSGRGWGHGVGMCQVGAYGMSIAGANYKQILAKYYQRTKIEKKY